MKALYLYGIRNKNPDSLDIHGAIDDNKVFTHQFKELQAIVSEVDLDKTSEAEITRRAQNDPKWITEEATKHQNVLEEAIKEQNGALIPMHFGTIFNSIENLEKMLKKKYENFKKTLQKLSNKEEWSVKVYVHEKRYKESLKKSHTLSKQTQKVKEADAGLDYFEELELNELTNNILEQELNKKSNLFYQKLKKQSCEAHKTKILNKELIKYLTQGESMEMMVLNSAYLIEQKKVARFISEVEKLQKENSEFTFNFTGPWPAYNFVE
jgi:hypothetical protein